MTWPRKHSSPKISHRKWKSKATLSDVTGITLLVYKNVDHRLRLPSSITLNKQHFFHTPSTTTTSTTMGLFGTDDPVKKEEKLIKQGM
jgi:hypothetical protein